jgi:capsular polysaccharide biosynthesis protein
VPALAVGSSTTVIFLTLFLALIMSVSTAFVMDYAKPTFHSAREITGYLGTPVLAVLSNDGA